MPSRRRLGDLAADHVHEAFTFSPLRYGHGVGLQPAARRDSGSDAETPSPPLWKGSQSPTRDLAVVSSTPKMTPRAQAIAAYRRDMLDMVRSLPEGAYELSLREIVEPPPPLPAANVEKETLIKKPGSMKNARGGMPRSTSLDSGMLIKLFLPLSLGGRSGGRKSLGAARCGSSRSPAPPGDRAKKNEWSGSEAASRRTSSSGSSSSSMSDGSNTSKFSFFSSKRSGCFRFFSRSKDERR